MKTKQNNWSFMVVKKSFVDLWYHDEDKYYNAFITVVLDENIKKKQNYISLATEINGECKFCIARIATQMMLNMFGGVGGIITIYNARTGEEIEEIDFDDLNKHDEEGNDRVAGDRPLSLEESTEQPQRVTLH